MRSQFNIILKFFFLLESCAAEKNVLRVFSLLNNALLIKIKGSF